MAWNANDSRGASMKRYDATNSIRVVVTPEQKQWLRSKAVNMQTISDVIRALIRDAMPSQK
jgi:hypothetical protein